MGLTTNFKQRYRNHKTSFRHANKKKQQHWTVRICMETERRQDTLQQKVESNQKLNPYNNWGFSHDVSKIQIENYWSSWNFTFVIYESSWKLVFTQIFAQNGSLAFSTLRLSFYTFAWSGIYMTAKRAVMLVEKWLISGNLAIRKSIILMFLSSSRGKFTLL